MPLRKQTYLPTAHQSGGKNQEMLQLYFLAESRGFKKNLSNALQKTKINYQVNFPTEISFQTNYEETT